MARRSRYSQEVRERAVRSLGRSRLPLPASRSASAATPKTPSAGTAVINSLPAHPARILGWRRHRRALRRLASRLMTAGRSAFFFSARMTRKRFVESHAATSSIVWSRPDPIVAVSLPPQSSRCLFQYVQQCETGRCGALSSFQRGSATAAVCGFQTRRRRASVRSTPPK